MKESWMEQYNGKIIVEKLFHENMEILSKYSGDTGCLSAVSLL